MTLDASIDFDPVDGNVQRVTLVGFMGAGKTTLAQHWAQCDGPVTWFDSDKAVLQRLACATMNDAFQEHSEAGVRSAELAVMRDRHAQLLRGLDVWSIGGGAIESEQVRSLIRDDCVVWLDVDVDVAWQRVAGSDRPNARNLDEFRKLYEQRQELYKQVATVRVDANKPIEELRLARELAEWLPRGWFGSGLAVQPGLIGRIHDLAVLHDRHIAVVYDEQVSEQAAAAIERLRTNGHSVRSVSSVAAGEFTKHLGSVESLADEWSGCNIDGDAVIVAFGGGALLDVVGLAASLYHRGVDWVSVPTTLTAQVDAGIGGKTAVNLGSAKNVIGSVHMPVATLIDPELLSTLPHHELQNGFVEAAKTALLAGQWLCDIADHAADQLSSEIPVQLIDHCASFKDSVVESDPFDIDGVRAQLNFGHTLGHAVESASGGSVAHGRAVAVGIHAALHISELVLGSSTATRAWWLELCKRVGIDCHTTYTWNEIAPWLTDDKKRDRAGLAWVLLRGPGEPVTRARVPIEAVERIWHEKIVKASDSSHDHRLETAKPRVLVLFGVHLGNLDQRSTSHYGGKSLANVVSQIQEWATQYGVSAECYQTDRIDRYLAAIRSANSAYDGIIVNPGAWTHYERSLHDALEMLDIPRAEVHFSDIENREDWRRESVIRDVVDTTISGEGAEGFRIALEWLQQRLETSQSA